MKVILRFVRLLAVYLAIVVGGMTVFLIFAPLFGYLPYSDRPGPGWYGSFPALSLREFLSNAWEMLGYGAFFLILFALAGVISVLFIWLLERFVRRPIAVRIAGGFITALITGYWMLGAGWYISAGFPLLILAILLGAVAGSWALPRRVEISASGA